MKRIFFFSLLFVGLLGAFPAHAALTCPKLPSGVTSSIVEERWIHVQVPIPGVTTTCVTDTGMSRDYIQDVGAYIAGLYKFFAGAIGILATVMVFYGGLRWLTAGGNPSRVKDAKQTISSALVAVLISLGSYLLLYTINPRLVNLRPPSLAVVNPVQQRFQTCPTTRECLSGPRLGTACTADADCGTAGSGACGFPVQLGTNEREPVCGKQYTYLGTSAGTDTCIGLACDIGGQVCANTLDPTASPAPGAAGCILPEQRCEAITDAVTGVGAGKHNDLCTPNTIAGTGMCTWFSRSGPAATDQCMWSEPLRCPSGYQRANCDVCNTANKTCNNAALIDSQNNESSTGVDAVCNSSAAETVYDRSLVTTGLPQTDAGGFSYFDRIQVRAICCQQISGPGVQCVSTTGTTKLNPAE